MSKALDWAETDVHLSASREMDRIGGLNRFSFNFMLP